MHSPKYHAPIVTLFGLLMLVAAHSLLGAKAENEQNAMWWNLVIAIIVLGVALASAALPAAAIRQWQGRWRLIALFPLLILVLWLGIIGLSRMADPDSHRLWPFEVFSWAMLNMIYMVAVMTCKRQIDKSEQLRQENTQPGSSASDQAP